MGNEIMGVDIAGIVADVMADGLFPVTITRKVKGKRQPGNLTGPRPETTVTFSAVGFWEDFNGTPPGIVLKLNDRKLILLGDTIEEGGHPQKNDACTVHEDIGDSTLFAVQLVKRDPAAATYQYLCRDRAETDPV